MHLQTTKSHCSVDAMCLYDMALTSSTIALQVRMVIHPNMHRFVGICLDEHNYCEYLLGEVCNKGTLGDILENEKIQLDWAFKHSMIKDLTEVYLSLTKRIHQAKFSAFHNSSLWSCILPGLELSSLICYWISWVSQRLYLHRRQSICGENHRLRNNHFRRSLGSYATGQTRQH